MDDAELIGEGDVFAKHVAENEWQHLNKTLTTVWGIKFVGKTQDMSFRNSLTSF